MTQDTLRQMIETELVEDILPFHYEKLCDARGGFYGHLANDLTIDVDMPKGLVQCARLLWTYARAYRLYKRPPYVEMAGRAYRELITRFHDPIHGGYIWSLTADGQPLDTTKMVYGQAFAIFGLSEMYMATGNQTALNHAVALFHLLEKQAVDNQYGGYWEACSIDWQPDLTLKVDTVSHPVAKSMNTHLHMMEAYANLFFVWQDATLRQRLQALIGLHCEHIIDSTTGHLRLHFDAQWQPLNDLVSYGHDIEASWLLWEAAELLADPTLLSSLRRVVLKMAEATFNEGLDQDGGLINETDGNGFLDDSRIWWAQAEALVGFLNAYQLTEEPHYLMAVYTIWHFIQQHLIDRQYGEWFWGVTRDGIPLQRAKAGMWKTPYHNGRACFELLRRLPTLN